MYSDKRVEKAELLEGLSIGKDDKTNVSPIQQVRQSLSPAVIYIYTAYMYIA